MFVGKDQNDGISHLTVIDDAVELLSRLVNAVSIGTVHHKDEALCTCVVVPPQRSYLVLPPNILATQKTA